MHNEEKTCIKCLQIKSIIDFSKCRSCKDGLQSSCKLCHKEWYSSNKESIKERKAEYDKKRYELKKDSILAYTKKYYSENIEHCRARGRKYYANNKESIEEKHKKYRELNREKRRAKTKEWEVKNRERRKEQSNKWVKDKYNSDPTFRLLWNLRIRIRLALKSKGLNKDKKTNDIIGCSSLYLREYIESKFESWMNWDNYGKYNGEENFGWDIDHIIPISSAKCLGDIYNLSHYTNLQPLCSFQNRCIKRNTISQKELEFTY